MPAETHAVPAISGAFMALRRADYARLGGLDEGYFLHVEDLDFCKRVHDAGGTIVCVPSVRVTHALSTSDVSSCFVERCKARGFLRYFRKHFARNTNPLLLWGVYTGILARCALRSARSCVRKFTP
jgi:GT2 family glycosyltransferase